MIIQALYTVGLFSSRMVLVSFYGISLGILINEIFTRTAYEEKNRIIDADLNRFVNVHAELLGIKKEIIFIKSDDFYYYGNNSLQGPVLLEVPNGVSLTDNDQKKKIIKALAMIQGDGLEKWAIIQVICAVAIRCLLSSFPLGSNLAEVCIGVITFMGVLGFAEYRTSNYADMALGWAGSDAMCP